MLRLALSLSTGPRWEVMPLSLGFPTGRKLGVISLLVSIERNGKKWSSLLGSNPWRWSSLSQAHMFSWLYTIQTWFLLINTQLDIRKWKSAFQISIGLCSLVGLWTIIKANKSHLEQKEFKPVKSWRWTKGIRQVERLRERSDFVPITETNSVTPFLFVGKVENKWKSLEVLCLFQFWL